MLITEIRLKREVRWVNIGISIRLIFEVSGRRMLGCWSAPLILEIVKAMEDYN